MFQWNKILASAKIKSRKKQENKTKTVLQRKTVCVYIIDNVSLSVCTS